MRESDGVRDGWEIIVCRRKGVGGRWVPEITLSISNQNNIDFALNSSWVNKVKIHLMLREKEKNIYAFDGRHT